MLSSRIEDYKYKGNAYYHEAKSKNYKYVLSPSWVTQVATSGFRVNPPYEINLANMYLKFGKYKGMLISEVKNKDPCYLIWLYENMNRNKTPESLQEALTYAKILIEMERKRKETGQYSEDYNLYQNQICEYHKIKDLMDSEKKERERKYVDDRPYIFERLLHKRPKVLPN